MKSVATKIRLLVVVGLSFWTMPLGAMEFKGQNQAVQSVLCTVIANIKAFDEACFQAMSNGNAVENVIHDKPVRGKKPETQDALVVKIAKAVDGVERAIASVQWAKGIIEQCVDQVWIAADAVGDDLFCIKPEDNSVIAAIANVSFVIDRALDDVCEYGKAVTALAVRVQLPQQVRCAESREGLEFAVAYNKIVQCRFTLSTTIKTLNSLIVSS